MTTEAEEAREKFGREANAQLRVMLAQVKELEVSTARIIKTEEGRHLINMLIRLIEIFIDGKPTTPTIPRYNA
jgi:hypothetical protein